MLSSQPTSSKNIEKVKIGEFINGVIKEVKDDEKHKFVWEGKETIQPAVQFVLELEGYEYPHFTKWYKWNTGEKSNIYKIFLTKLVDGATPGMVIDSQIFRGMKVKTIWAEKGEYQYIELIAPLGAKLKADATVHEDEESIPF